MRQSEKKTGILTRRVYLACAGVASVVAGASVFDEGEEKSVWLAPPEDGLAPFGWAVARSAWRLVMDVDLWLSSSEGKEDGVAFEVAQGMLQIASASPRLTATCISVRYLCDVASKYGVGHRGMSEEARTIRRTLVFSLVRLVVLCSARLLPMGASWAAVTSGVTGLPVLAKMPPVYDSTCGAEESGDPEVYRVRTGERTPGFVLAGRVYRCTHVEAATGHLTAEPPRVDSVLPSPSLPRVLPDDAEARYLALAGPLLAMLRAPAPLADAIAPATTLLSLLPLPVEVLEKSRSILCLSSAAPIGPPLPGSMGVQTAKLIHALRPHSETASTSRELLERVAWLDAGVPAPAVADVALPHFMAHAGHGAFALTLLSKCAAGYASDPATSKTLALLALGLWSRASLLCPGFVPDSGAATLLARLLRPLPVDHRLWRACLALALGADAVLATADSSSGRSSTRAAATPRPTAATAETPVPLAATPPPIFVAPADSGNDDSTTPKKPLPEDDKPRTEDGPPSGRALGTRPMQPLPFPLWDHRRGTDSGVTERSSSPASSVQSVAAVRRSMLPEPLARTAPLRAPALVPVLLQLVHRASGGTRLLAVADLCVLFAGGSPEAPFASQAGAMAAENRERSFGQRDWAAWLAEIALHPSEDEDADTVSEVNSGAGTPKSEMEGRNSASRAVEGPRFEGVSSSPSKDQDHQTPSKDQTPSTFSADDSWPKDMEDPPECIRAAALLKDATDASLPLEARAASTRRLATLADTRARAMAARGVLRLMRTTNTPRLVAIAAAAAAARSFPEAHAAATRELALATLASACPHARGGLAVARAWLDLLSPPHQAASIDRPVRIRRASVALSPLPQVRPRDAMAPSTQNGAVLPLIREHADEMVLSDAAASAYAGLLLRRLEACEAVLGAEIEVVGGSEWWHRTVEALEASSALVLGIEGTREDEPSEVAEAERHEEALLQRLWGQEEDAKWRVQPPESVQAAKERSRLVCRPWGSDGAFAALRAAALRVIFRLGASLVEAGGRALTVDADRKRQVATTAALQASWSVAAAAAPTAAKAPWNMDVQDPEVQERLWTAAVFGWALHRRGRGRPADGRGLKSLAPSDDEHDADSYDSNASEAASEASDDDSSAEILNDWVDVDVDAHVGEVRSSPQKKDSSVPVIEEEPTSQEGPAEESDEEHPSSPPPQTEPRRRTASIADPTHAQAETALSSERRSSSGGGDQSSRVAFASHPENGTDASSGIATDRRRRSSAAMLSAGATPGRPRKGSMSQLSPPRSAGARLLGSSPSKLAKLVRRKQAPASMGPSTRRRPSLLPPMPPSFLAQSIDATPTGEWDLAPSASDIEARPYACISLPTTGLLLSLHRLAEDAARLDPDDAKLAALSVPPSEPSLERFARRKSFWVGGTTRRAPVAWSLARVRRSAAEADAAGSLLAMSASAKNACIPTSEIAAAACSLAISAQRLAARSDAPDVLAEAGRLWSRAQQLASLRGAPVLSSFDKSTISRQTASILAWKRRWKLSVYQLARHHAHWRRIAQEDLAARTRREEEAARSFVEAHGAWLLRPVSQTFAPASASPPMPASAVECPLWNVAVREPPRTLLSPVDTGLGPNPVLVRDDGRRDPMTASWLITERRSAPTSTDSKKSTSPELPETSEDPKKSPPSDRRYTRTASDSSLDKSSVLGKEDEEEPVVLSSEEDEGIVAAREVAAMGATLRHGSQDEEEEEEEEETGKGGEESSGSASDSEEASSPSQGVVQGLERVHIPTDMSHATFAAPCSLLLPWCVLTGRLELTRARLMFLPEGFAGADAEDEGLGGESFDPEVEVARAQAEKVASKVEWEPDREARGCAVCHRSLVRSLFRSGRHHCRRCGKVVCDTCSSQRRTLVRLGHPEPVRVCDLCATEEDELRAATHRSVLSKAAAVPRSATRRQQRETPEAQAVMRRVRRAKLDLVYPRSWAISDIAAVYPARHLLRPVAFEVVFHPQPFARRSVTLALRSEEDLAAVLSRLLSLCLTPPRQLLYPPASLPGVAHALPPTYSASVMGGAPGRPSNPLPDLGGGFTASRRLEPADGRPPPPPIGPKVSAMPLPLPANGPQYSNMPRPLDLPDAVFAWTRAWQCRFLSNLDYLLLLNRAAGRTAADLTRFPVMPWVITDYSSDELDLDNPAVFRDLSKPVGALDSARLEALKERREAMGPPDEDTPSFLYGSHYSNIGTVLYFLIRREPFTTHALALQGGSFDHADRLFHSMAEAWGNVLSNPSDVKELVPELFCDPSVLSCPEGLRLGTRQDGVTLGDVDLPPWAHGDPDRFVRLHREALESEHVSERLHLWIDLVFGVAQRGEEAERRNNVFHPYTYEGGVHASALADPVSRRSAEAQVATFGQTPSQLFEAAHPRRLTRMEALEVIWGQARASQLLSAWRRPPRTVFRPAGPGFGIQALFPLRGRPALLSVDFGGRVAEHKLVADHAGARRPFEIESGPAEFVLCPSLAARSIAFGRPDGTSPGRVLGWAPLLLSDDATALVLSPAGLEARDLDGKLVWRRPGRAPSSAAVSADGSLCAVGFVDGTVELSLVSTTAGGRSCGGAPELRPGRGLSGTPFPTETPGSAARDALAALAEGGVALPPLGADESNWADEEAPSNERIDGSATALEQTLASTAAVGLTALAVASPPRSHFRLLEHPLAGSPSRSSLLENEEDDARLLGDDSEETKPKKDGSDETKPKKDSEDKTPQKKSIFDGKERKPSLVGVFDMPPRTVDRRSHRLEVDTALFALHSARLGLAEAASASPGVPASALLCNVRSQLEPCRAVLGVPVGRTEGVLEHLGVRLGGRSKMAAASVAAGTDSAMLGHGSIAVAARQVMESRGTSSGCIAAAAGARGWTDGLSANGLWRASAAVASHWSRAAGLPPAARPHEGGPLRSGATVHRGLAAAAAAEATVGSGTASLLWSLATSARAAAAVGPPRALLTFLPASSLATSHAEAGVALSAAACAPEGILAAIWARARTDISAARRVYHVTRRNPTPTPLGAPASSFLGLAWAVALQQKLPSLPTPELSSDPKKSTEPHPHHNPGVMAIGRHAVPVRAPPRNSRLAVALAHGLGSEGASVSDAHAAAGLPQSHAAAAPGSGVVGLVAGALASTLQALNHGTPALPEAAQALAGAAAAASASAALSVRADARAPRAAAPPAQAPSAYHALFAIRPLLGDVGPLATELSGSSSGSSSGTTSSFPLLPGKAAAGAAAPWPSVPLGPAVPPKPSFGTDPPAAARNPLLARPRMLPPLLPTAPFARPRTSFSHRVAPLRDSGSEMGGRDAEAVGTKSSSAWGSPDGNWVATNHTTMVTAVSVAADLGVLLSADTRGRVVVQDMATWRPLREINLRQAVRNAAMPPARIQALLSDFPPIQTMDVTSAGDVLLGAGSLLVGATVNGKVRRLLDLGMPIVSVRASRSQRFTLVVTQRTADIRWTADLAPRVVIETQPPAPITAAAISHDQTLVILGFQNGAIAIYPVNLDWGTGDAPP